MTKKKFKLKEHLWKVPAGSPCGETFAYVEYTPESGVYADSTSQAVLDDMEKDQASGALTYTVIPPYRADWANLVIPHLEHVLKAAFEEGWTDERRARVQRIIDSFTGAEFAIMRSVYDDDMGDRLRARITVDMGDDALDAIMEEFYDPNDQRWDSWLAAVAIRDGLPAA